MAEFTHFKKDGSAVMVDVHEKPDTYRAASATGTIQVSPEVFAAVRDHTAKKGDVLGVARLAGIMGAKKNAELIPLCHIVPLTNCEVTFTTSKKARTRPRGSHRWALPPLSTSAAAASDAARRPR